MPAGGGDNPRGGLRGRGEGTAPAPAAGADAPHVRPPPRRAQGGNLSPGGTGAPTSSASEIDIISVANVPSTSPGNQRLWAHLISAWVISIFAMRVRARGGRRARARVQARGRARRRCPSTPRPSPRPSLPPPPRPPQLLLNFSNDISRLRAKFLSTLPRGATSHSVLVTDVPGLERGMFRRGAAPPPPPQPQPPSGARPASPLPPPLS